MTITFLDVSALPYEDFHNLSEISPTKASPRKDILSQFTKDSKLLSIADVKRINKMTWFQEAVALFILVFGVPGFAISLPILLLTIGYLSGSILRTFVIGVLLIAPLSFTPAPFIESSLSSWIAYQMVSYFSFKIMYEQELQGRNLCRDIFFSIPLY